MKIIGIVGLIGSGKDEAANYIAERYSYRIINMSDIFREILRSEGIEPTRKNLQEERVKRGMRFLAQEVVKRIKNMAKKGVEKIVITSVRRPEDYEIVKKAFGDYKLIQIFADKEKRFERMKKRGRPGDPKTLEEFEKQENKDKEIFEFEKTFKYADYKIDNNGTKEDLRNKIDELMKRIN